MRVFIKNLALIAVAAIGLTACQNSFEEQNQIKESVVINFIADSADSRTSVDTTGTKPMFAWDEEESFTVLEQTDALAVATSVAYEKVYGKASISAEFNLNAGKGEYNYVTIYPKSGYVNAESLMATTLVLPTNQTMVANSYDPEADLMVSKVVTTSAQPTEAQQVCFTRLASVVKMSLRNFNIEPGDKVESVTFTAEGKSLAGNLTVDCVNPHAFEVDTEASSSSVTVATSSDEDIYFTTLPTTLEAGDVYTIIVVTSKRLYVKQGSIPEGRSLQFVAGMVSRFGVDMSGVAPSDKWVLVKDASTLHQGDVITIAASEYDYVLGGKKASNLIYASYTDIIKVGDYLYHPIATAESDAEDRIQHLTLAKRNNEQNAFDLYDGVDFEDDEVCGFLCAPQNTNYINRQEYTNHNTLFHIDIDGGIASIVAKDSDYDYKQLSYYHGDYSSTRKFYCIAEDAMADTKHLCIYKLYGGVGELPLIEANVVVPTESESVDISEEGVVSATTIEEVLFNYVGDWDISVTDSADWLSVNYDATNNCLTYTAEANSGARREATVTITASYEGQQDLTWTFKVCQKGAVIELSIAEFITKEKDLDITYRLTGKVVEANASSGGTYHLQDAEGNKATITYLFTDAGDRVWDNAEIGLAVGDIVTVTTVVTSATKGLGGSSTYHSIYKGHYNLSATASPTSVGYEGGSSIISITKCGNMQPVDGTIRATKSANSDFATLSYSDNAETATVIFEENSGSQREVVITFAYGDAEAVVTISQEKSPILQIGWLLVTSVSELSVGDKIIITGKNPENSQSYAISNTTTTNSYRPSIPITLQGTSISNVTDTQQYTLERGDATYPGTWAFKGGSDSKYLSVTNGYLKVASALNANGSWNVSIAADGEATLVSQTSVSKTTIMLHYTTYSSPTFNVFKPEETNKGAIYLYKYYD